MHAHSETTGHADSKTASARICCVVAGFAIFICVMFYAVVWPDPVYQVKVAQFEAEV